MTYFSVYRDNIVIRGELINQWLAMIIIFAVKLAECRFDDLWFVNCHTARNMWDFKILVCLTVYLLKVNSVTFNY